MKAVYSLWEDNRKKQNGGFVNKRQLALSLTLSVKLAKKQFGRVEFYTNNYGKELVDKYKIPFDEVIVRLDEFDNKLDPDFWAYAKIFTYSVQKEPFIHIDNDVFIWDTISDDILNSDLFFQNKEKFEDHRGYLRLINEAKCFPRINFNILSSHPDFAYNCGVVGVNNLEVIREWKTIVDEYLFSPKNQQVWQKIRDKHSHNHLFEQFFISSLIKEKNLNVNTILADDFYKSAIRDFKYTHLWGETKRDQVVMMRVEKRLFEEFPEVEENFSVVESHNEIFDDIYRNELWGRGQGSGGGSSPEITFEYRKFLQDFLRDFNIKTVADFGCGDWQFSNLINWDGIDYVGYDCVKTIIENNKQQFKDENISFVLEDKISNIKDKFDLLIMKDVLIHWTNAEVIEFFEKIKELNFKYVLITNQVNNSFNVDIKTGQFRRIDITKEPFNIDAEIVFNWENDDKKTYLLINKSVK